MAANPSRVRVALLAAILIAPCTARAETMRSPASGSPALEAEAPAGWTVGATGPFATAAAPGSGVRLAFAVESRQGALALPSSVYVLSLLPPTAAASAAGKARLGAIDGEVFRTTSPDGRIVLGRIDPQHMAVFIEMVTADASTADRQALRKLEDTVRVAP